MKANICFLWFHPRKWVYQSESSCTQDNVCERCQQRHRRNQIVHVWGEDEILTLPDFPDYSTRVRTCQRCGAEDPPNARAIFAAQETCTHSFEVKPVDADIRDSWNGYSMDSRNIAFTIETRCSKCKLVESREYVQT